MQDTDEDSQKQEEETRFYEGCGGAGPPRGRLERFVARLETTPMDTTEDPMPPPPPREVRQREARTAGAAARACWFRCGAIGPPERYYQFTEGCSFRVRRR